MAYEESTCPGCGGRIINIDVLPGPGERHTERVAIDPTPHPGGIFLRVLRFIDSRKDFSVRSTTPASRASLERTDPDAVYYMPHYAVCATNPTPGVGLMPADVREEINALLQRTKHRARKPVA